jgi:hypothetical protein
VDNEENSLSRRSLFVLAGTAAGTALIVRPTEALTSAEPILEAEIIEEETLPDLYDPSVRRTTRLEAFLKGSGIKPAHLARECGYSRQHFLRLRLGRMEPTRRCIAAIVAACGRLTRRRVRATDLFDLGDR